MTSSLDRLKAAAAAGKTATPAAQPAAQPTPSAAAPLPTQAASEAPAASLPTTPAPQAETVAQAPTPTHTPAATQAVAVSTPTSASAGAMANVDVSTDESAKNALALLFGNSDGEVPASAAEIFDEIDGGGGLAFTHPFAQIRKGNWDVHKSCPPSLIENMPAGKRPYSMIYLGYRVGAMGWPVTKGAVGGAAPLFKYAIPHRRMLKESPEITRQTLAYGSKIQFKQVNDEQYKHLGKLTPDIQIFGWRPDTGFIILTVSGFSPSKLTADSLASKAINDTEGLGPIVFSVGEEKTTNNKKPVGDPSREWTDYYIKADFQPTESKSMDLFNAWEAFKQKSITTVATEVIKFHKAADFNGLSASAIVEKLNSYKSALGL